MNAFVYCLLCVVTTLFPNSSMGDSMLFLPHLSGIPANPFQYGYQMVDSTIQYFNVPSIRFRHQCFGYNDNILLIGGYDDDDDDFHCCRHHM